MKRIAAARTKRRMANEQGKQFQQVQQREAESSESDSDTAAAPAEERKLNVLIKADVQVLNHTWVLVLCWQIGVHMPGA